MILNKLSKLVFFHPWNQYLFISTTAKIPQLVIILGGSMISTMSAGLYGWTSSCLGHFHIFILAATIHYTTALLFFESLTMLENKFDFISDNHMTHILNQYGHIYCSWLVPTTLIVTTTTSNHIQGIIQSVIL